VVVDIDAKLDRAQCLFSILTIEIFGQWLSTSFPYSMTPNIEIAKTRINPCFLWDLASKLLAA
jgi:hypothetical protein